MHYILRGPAVNGNIKLLLAISLNLNHNYLQSPIVGSFAPKLSGPPLFVTGVSSNIFFPSAAFNYKFNFMSMATSWLIIYRLKIYRHLHPKFSPENPKEPGLFRTVSPVAINIFLSVLIRYMHPFNRS